MDDGRYWPVVADFFLTVIAIFVLLYSTVEPPDTALIRLLTDLRTGLENARARGEVLKYEANEREIRIVYSEKALGFQSCRWDLSPASAEQLRMDLERLEPFEKYTSRLTIEGHADIQPATNCVGLRFKSNFELSGYRAMSVFAALLARPVQELDEAVLATRNGVNRARFIERMTAGSKVLVAGFGATRLLEDEPDPTALKHRRVEVRLVLEKAK